MERIPFFLKHKVEFAASLLLIFYWLDFSRMATFIARKAGKYNLWLGAMMAQLKPEVGREE